MKELSKDPQSGVHSWTSYRFRHIWGLIYALKVFLTEKGLVKKPLGSDPFYHIPALETGHKTFGHIHFLIRENGWYDWARAEVSPAARVWEESGRESSFETLGRRTLPVIDATRQIWNDSCQS